MDQISQSLNDALKVGVETLELAELETKLGGNESSRKSGTEKQIINF